MQAFAVKGNEDLIRLDAETALSWATELSQ